MNACCISQWMVAALSAVHTYIGAVLYGCHPELIHARRSRSTYGIKACAPYVEGAPGKVTPGVPSRPPRLPS